MRLFKTLLFAVFCIMAEPLFGVIIAGTDGATNTNAPADDPGFNYIGVSQLNRSTVYLGNSWFLTANHNGEPSTIKMGGTTYSYMPATWRQLTNNLGAGIDLAMFKITSNPAGGVPIRTISPSVNSTVVMIGNGRNRTSGLTYWDSSWNEVSELSYTYSGYKYSSSATATSLRWGSNTVNTINIAYEGMILFASDFDHTTGEGQAAPGDSGGGVFIKKSGQWQLAGIMLYTQNPLPGQPANTALMGDETYMADLSGYRGQITNIVSISDLDSDQLPDLWEYRYSGNATGLVSTANNDGDSFDNYEEYIADTNPTNAASFFEMSGLLVSTNQTITFNGSTARQYQVFYTTNDLADTNLPWAAAHTNLIWGSGTNSSITVTTVAEKAFYRLKAILP